MQRKALGKGLDALFGPSTGDDSREITAESRRLVAVSVKDIIPNRNQPREVFSDEAMDDLKKSIADNGIIEPPIVRRFDGFFELIAGERRFRAAKELGFDSIDVIVMEDISDEKVLVLSLIENIQRENLNAIEEAKAYHQIMETMSATQEELADIVGKSRSTVANMMRLLALPDTIQHMVSDGTLAPGSARALITIPDKHLQFKLARKIAADGLSARKAESLVKKALSEDNEEKAPKQVSPFVTAFRENLQRALGSEVKVKGDDRKGKIEIPYHSREDLERILEALKVGSFD